MDPQLQRLQELQALDSRLTDFERRLEAIPGRLRTVRDRDLQARTSLDALRSKLDGVRKETRAREKDLDAQASQRAKCEARLYEVKTNKEYSAVLAEIETLKVDKSRIEEDILALMELQERLGHEVVEAETRLAHQTQETKGEEAAAAEELQVLEADLAVVRTERESLARDLPRDLVAQYTRLLKGRGGLAVARVGADRICAGCRMSLTPQRFQEVRQSSHILFCENCGRILYYQP